MPRPTRTVADAPGRGSSPLDFEQEASRIGPREGIRRQFARNGVRTFFGEAGGSGTSDLVQFGNDVIVSIINCVMRKTTRWRYDSEEPLIMLRASLCCNVAFHFDGVPLLVFNRPEVVVAVVPEGQRMVVDIIGGARQQGIVAVMRASTFAARYGLRHDDLPPPMQDAMRRSGAVGRIASFPLDQRIASLVADTIDSPLEGEMLAVQYGGRLAELVAYALDAMNNTPSLQTTVLKRQRDVELVESAFACLERDYRRPPLFAELAREIGTNQNKLKSLFKSAYGLTMADYCLERRMREAQQLLLDGKLTIGQIAERVGYEHQSSFATAFRGHIGMAPREYRRHRAPLSVALGRASPIA